MLVRLFRFAEMLQSQDDRLDELLFELSHLESSVTLDIEVADSEEPVDDVSLFAFFSDNHHLFFGGDEIRNEVDDGTVAGQPVTSAYYPLAAVHPCVYHFHGVFEL